MELVDAIERKLTELKNIKSEILKINETVKKDMNNPEVNYPKLYEKEFELCMDLSNQYDSLMSSLVVLEFKEGMDFFVRRVRKEADSLLSSEVLRVDK